MLVALQPSGKYVAVDLHRVDGIPLSTQTLLKAGLLHGDCMTVTGKTVAESLKDVPDTPPAGQDVAHPVNDPIYPERHLAILCSDRAPRRLRSQDRRS